MSAAAGLKQRVHCFNSKQIMFYNIPIQRCRILS